MNKLTLTICFCLIFSFIVSCERADITEKIEAAYDYVNAESTESGDNEPSDELPNPTDNPTDPTDEQTDPTEPSNPECSEINITPCKDSASSLIWSSKTDYKTWNQAIDYCKDLTEGDFSDWHLPSIDELRTLIQNCPATETGGSCGINDKCLYYECKNDACSDCSKDSSGKYSKLGDTGWLWSSSVLPGYSDYRWIVNFIYGSVGNNHIDNNYDVRCVRKVE